MKKIDEVCEKYNIALCYLFGSQQELGKALLKRKKVEMVDRDTGNMCVNFLSPKKKTKGGLPCG
jgi:ribosomal protein L7Ae-like RNA K-turn-binding protein